jgi:NADH:ubiquinone oxidoreductase subunit 6 (subunit J)
MPDLVFIAIMVVTVGGALVALEAEEIVYGAIALAGSLFGVAALFFLLNAPYVAVFQITVYVGAVAVLIIFTVMLVRQEKWAKEVPPQSVARLAGILTAVAIAVSFGFAAAGSTILGTTTLINSVSFLQIGELISRNFAPILETLALVLAASIIGALTLSKVEREEDKK